MNSFSFNDAIRFRLATQQDVDHDPYPPCGCSGRDILRLFGVLAEGERPTCEYAIMELTGLWNHHGCHCEFLVALSSLLRNARELD